MGPSHFRKRLQDSRSCPPRFYGVFPTGGPRAGSGHRTRSKYSPEEGDHQGGPCSWQRVQVLQPLPHRLEEGWSVVSLSRSSSAEPSRYMPLVQNADIQSGHVSIKSQVWFVIIDLKDAYFLSFLNTESSWGLLSGGKHTSSSFFHSALTGPNIST